MARPVSQCVADRGVQAGVGNGHFLRQGRSHEAGEDEQRQNERTVMMMMFFILS